MISTPVSCAAFTAPAWIDFQNSADAPLGMTAILVVLPLAVLLLQEAVARGSATHAPMNVRLCIVNTQYHGADAAIQCLALDILNLQSVLHRDAGQRSGAPLRISELLVGYAHRVHERDQKRVVRLGSGELMCWPVLIAPRTCRAGRLGCCCSRDRSHARTRRTNRRACCLAASCRFRRRPRRARGEVGELLGVPVVDLRERGDWPSRGRGCGDCR